MHLKTASLVKSLYWVSIILFTILFTISIYLNVSDFETSIKETVRLGFPAWLPYPQTLAKALGLLVILFSKSNTLKSFAYAGFLFNLLCALGGHISQQDGDILLAGFGILIWCFAFVMDFKYRYK